MSDKKKAITNELDLSLGEMVPKSKFIKMAKIVRANKIGMVVNLKTQEEKDAFEANWKDATFCPHSLAYAYAHYNFALNQIADMLEAEGS